MGMVPVREPQYRNIRGDRKRCNVRKKVLSEIIKCSARLFLF
jgi:hypothetical protein